MANTVKLKRSAVAGKAPTTTDLALGELGLNTHDGKAYMKKSDGNGVEEVVEVGAPVLNPMALSNKVIDSDFIVPNGYNSASFDEVTVNPGVTVTLDQNSTWVVLA